MSEREKGVVSAADVREAYEKYLKLKYYLNNDYKRIENYLNDGTWATGQTFQLKSIHFGDIAFNLKCNKENIFLADGDSVVDYKTDFCIVYNCCNDDIEFTVAGPPQIVKEFLQKHNAKISIDESVFNVFEVFKELL